MSEWQPIETAPKDGTRILLLIPAIREPVQIGRWMDIERREHGVVVHRITEWSWGSLYPSMPGSKVVDPTRWQPLPAVTATDERGFV